jgi:hypothetical protein
MNPHFPFGIMNEELSAKKGLMIIDHSNLKNKG